MGIQIAHVRLPGETQRSDLKAGSAHEPNT